MTDIPTWLPGEQEAVEQVIAYGHRFGYGNLITHLQHAWKDMLMNDWALDEETARHAVGLEPLPSDDASFCKRALAGAVSRITHHPEVPEGQGSRPSGGEPTIPEEAKPIVNIPVSELMDRVRSGEKEATVAWRAYLWQLSVEDRRFFQSTQDLLEEIDSLKG